MTRVHPHLEKVTIAALDYSQVDLTVLSDTLRTEQKQAELVADGRSKTMASLHLPQASGFVHAVDIGALEGGTLSWRPDVYFDVARAMQHAARELKIPVTWGGCWADISGVKAIYQMHADYVARKAAQGRRPFFDGPHFQLPRGYK